MPESFIATVQQLRRVVIPPNVFKVMGLKEGDQVRVTIEKLEQSVQLVDKEEKK
jgi:bifunctional DNA-binding transcriptional regulator/antitoxin component of YhaV-PrlF toxin-antitoxin module